MDQMAPSNRQPSFPGRDYVLKIWTRCEFFQLVRLLQHVFQCRMPVGGETTPRDAAIQIAEQVSAVFPPRDVDRLVVPEDRSEPIRMYVTFMGFGNILPDSWVAWLQQRARRGDDAFFRLLDLFTHRFVTLWCRFRARLHVAVNFENAGVYQIPDHIASSALALSGVHRSHLQKARDIREEAVVYYAGLFGRHPRSGSALASLLSDYFGVSVTVIQLEGAWLTLAAENRTRLGHEQEHSVLGNIAVLGLRAWRPDAKFRLRVGPLSLEEYRQFLPSGRALGPLIQMTRLFAGDNLLFDVQLILKRPALPRCQLGGKQPCPPRVGWSAWLRTEQNGDSIHGAVLPGRELVDDISIHLNSYREENA